MKNVSAVLGTLILVMQVGFFSSAVVAQPVVDEHQNACEAEANARGRKGAEFDKYVSSCLDKRVDARMTLASVPAEKLEGCKRAANTIRLKDDKRRDFVIKCATRQPDSAGGSIVPHEKMQACKREANARRYKGKAFDDYVAGCTAPVEF
ncbi:MAG TPA: hypothetical protein VLC92_19650 [Rhodocyclaceae bacterium]|nr:hypothetical protein [Rhodocyclaceae bacterium]